MNTLYICNIFSPNRKKKYDISSDSPAAYNKVKKVSKALKQIGIDISIVSLSSGNSVKHKWIPFDVEQIVRVETYFLASATTKVLRNILSFFNLLFFAIKNVNKFDNVIFYNFQIEFLPTALFCKLIGKKIIVDVEDGINQELPLHVYYYRKMLLFVFSILCDRNFLTVSTKLRDQLKPRNSVICYGVESVEEANLTFNTDVVKIIFGGSLCDETGVPHLIQLCNIINQNKQIIDKVQIQVTGFGPAEEMLRTSVSDYSFIDVLGRVDFDDYERLLSSADVGLVFKNPKTSMGNTTFPSKIVELTSKGIVVISTYVSDVPKLFNKDEIIFVETAYETYCGLITLIENRHEAKMRAKRIYEKADAVFNEMKVAQAIQKTFNI